MITEMQLGEFAPDLPDYKNPGLVACDNVYAVAGGYAPLSALLDSGLTYTGSPRGAKRFDRPGMASVVVFGTDSDLFFVDGSTVTASGLALTVPAGGFWSFEQFGVSVYATCKGVGTFKLADILSDTAFAAAPSSPPSASCVAAFGDFLFMGDLEDIDSSDAPYRVRWSSFNDPSGDWTADIGRQSGAVDMNARYGEVTGLSAGITNLIFQRDAVSRIEYTGGATIFSKREIDIERGCIAPRSLVRVGGVHYFLAKDGFCRTSGAGVEVISRAKVFDWFSQSAVHDHSESVIGAVDWARNTIIWMFKADGFGTFNRALLFNWSLERWTTASFESDWLTDLTETGIDIDETDPGVSGDDTLDVLGPSFDDSRYDPKRRSVIAFHEGKIKYFSGPSLEATFETGDFQISPQKRSFIRSVRLIATESGGVNYQVGGRSWGDAQKVYAQAQTEGALGFAPCASDALFHSLRAIIPSGVSWSRAAVIQVDSIESGLA